MAGGLNLYGFANGDPVNFGDPFGLCPEELRDSSGRCPGGLAVSEWNAVEESMGHISSLGQRRIRTALHAGNIRGYSSRGFRSPLGYSEDEVGARVTVEDPETIQVNRNHTSGNYFFADPQELAGTLLEESQHVVQMRPYSEESERRKAYGIHSELWERAAKAWARANLREQEER